MNGSRGRLTRRSFLKALGLSAGVAPFVPYLNRFAEAQTSPGFPRRLLLTYAPNGTVESRFWPVGTETAFTFPKGAITESLAPYQSSIVFAKGLTRTKGHGGGPHENAMGSLWTGSSLGPSTAQSGGYGFPLTASIDQIIVGKVPQTTPFPSLALSVAHDAQLPGPDQHAASKYMTYSGPNSPVLPDADPYHVFRTLVLTGSVGGPITAASVDRARAQMSSVIDLVQGDLKALSGKIDADDRAKVDAHVQGLREIEMRVQAASMQMAPQGASCSAPALPDGYAGMLYDNDSFPALVKMQTDLMVAALACDQTRVASLQWSRSLNLLRHTWLDPQAPEHHLNSHETTPAAVTWQYRMSYWYCQQFADLLGKLAAVKEGNGTLLDNTLAVWSYDMNLGAGHILPPHVVVLAGGLGGKTITGTTGRLVDYQGKYDWTQLLVTLCHAMGATDVNVVGNLGVPGSIPGLFNA
jgi:hypothetical protein